MLKPVRWLAKREAAHFRDVPGMRIHFGRRRHGEPGSQVLRAFIQINVLPRPR